MPIITTTINSSIRVKPFRFIVRLPYEKVSWGALGVVA
jgi:hypothetical protein